MAYNSYSAHSFQALTMSIIIISGLVSSVTAIRCYQCSTTAGDTAKYTPEDCFSFNKQKLELKECFLKSQTSCMKTTNHNEGYIAVSRVCGVNNKNLTEDVCKEHNKVEICECIGDGCNRAGNGPHLSTSLFTSLLLCVTVIFYLN